MKNELKKLGLSDKDIDIYLSGLRMGSSSVQEISKKAGIKRSTTYLILDNLKKLGLASMVIKGNKKLIVMEEPEKLLKIVQEEKREIENKEESIKTVIPEIKAISNKSIHITRIKSYESKEGIWSILEDILRSREDIFGIGSGKMYDHVGLSRFLNDFTKKRRQIGKTKSYFITDHHPQNIKYYNEGDTNFREIRFLTEISQLDSAIIIYGGKIVLLLLEVSLTGVVIESQTLAQTLKFIFWILWKELENKNLPQKR